MALPQRKDTSDNNRYDSHDLSAQERANQHWGTAGHTPSSSDSEVPEETGEKKSALQRAEDSWGSAGVHQGGGSNGGVYDRPGNDSASPSSSNSEQETEGNKTSRQSSKDESKTESGASSIKNAVAGLAGDMTPVGRIAGLLAGSKRKKAGLAGVISAVVVIAGIIIGTPFLGPLQWVHFAQNMSIFHNSDQEEMSQSRAGKILKWQYYKHDVSKTRLGYIANKQADKVTAEMKKNGFTIKVDSLGLFKGIELDPRAAEKGIFKGTEGMAPEDVKARLALELGADVSRISYANGKYTIAADGLNRISNGKLIGKVYGNSIDRGKAWSAYQKRLLIKKVGLTFDPVTKLKNRAGQSIVERLKEIRESRSSRLTGTEPTPDVRATGDKDPNGNTDPTSTDAANGANAAAEEAKAGKLQSGAVKGAIGIAFLCVAKSIADEASVTNKINIITMAMNTAAEVYSVATKGQDGSDIDATAHSEYSKSLFSKTNGSWSDANTVKNEFGEGQGKKLPPELDPEETKSIGSQLLGAIPGLDAVCSVLNNTFVSIIMAVIDGPIAILAQGFFMTPAGQALFEKVVALFVRTIPDVSSAQYAGSPYGEMANVGGRLVANETSLSMAGRVLTNGEEVALSNQTKLEQLQDNKNRSVADRYFNPYLATSLTGQLIDHVRADSAASVFKQLGSTFLNLPQLLSSRLVPTAHAATVTLSKTEVYYNIPKVGFTQKNDDDVENPLANADQVADILQGPDADHYLDLLARCNNITVVFGDKGMDFSPGQGATTEYDKIDADCKSDADSKWVQVRMAVYDTINTKSIACLDHDDQESCDDIKGTPGDGGGETAGGPINAQGWAWPVNASDLQNQSAGLYQCWLHFFTYKSGYHSAIDVAVVNKPIYAAHDGKIVAKYNDGYNTLILDAGLDTSTGQHLYAVYMHMSSITVANGEAVTAGQRIGTSGAVGAPLGPHLHFGISSSMSRFGTYADPWATANPLDFLPSDNPVLERDSSGSCKTADIITQPDYGFATYKSRGTFDAYK